MNILQILPELNVGGVETGTVDLAREFIKRGHKAVVVSAGGQLVKDLEAAGAIHYQLPVHKKSLYTMIQMVPRLSAIIKKEEIDIVHARSRIPAWPAYFASRKTRIVFITTCHGHYSRHPISYVMGWGTRVIVLSNAIARHMIDDFGVPHERITLIPRSVDLGKFTFVSPEKKKGAHFNVGMIGRITPLKGHNVFFKAMAKVARAVPQLKIWIVGEAPDSRQAYKDQLQILVKRLGLEQATQFLGTQRDIPGILNNLDVLVLATTTHEAFGRVIIEAQAAGVPVVATRVGGVVDIIEDGYNGLLVPPSDPAGMAEAVTRIYQDADLGVRLAHHAYAKVKKKYNLNSMVDSTLEAYQDARKNKKILIIKLSSLGDIVLSTAAVKAVREHFPAECAISFLVGEESKEVLLRCPYIDELLVCDLKDRYKGLPGLLRLGALLRKKGFDIVIDFQNNRKSHLLAGLSCAPDRYGFDRKFGGFLNHRIKDGTSPMAPVAHQFQILKMLGIELKNPRLELWLDQEDEVYVNQLLSDQWLSAAQKIIGLNVNASSRWLTKSWPLAHMIKFCGALAHRDMRIVLTGTQGDFDKAHALTEALKEAKLINACGKTTVNQLACLIKHCSAYVSTDSAPLHIAASVNVPYVAIFGSTDPRRHLPPGDRFVVIKKELACSPCYKARCKTIKCMQLISPEEVLAAVESLLKP